MPGSSLFGGHDTGICQSAAGEESEAVRGSGQFLRHVSSRVFPVCEWHGYTNIVEFREAMLRRTPQISRSLVSKLLELGTGRRMEIGDRPAIDDIVEELEGRGNGFYDLVELVASSETFGRP